MRISLILSFAFFLFTDSSPTKAPDQIGSFTAASRPKISHNIICWDGISGAMCEDMYGCGCSDDGGFYDGGLWPEEGNSCTSRQCHCQST